MNAGFLTRWLGPCLISLGFVVAAHSAPARADETSSATLKVSDVHLQRATLSGEPSGSVPPPSYQQQNLLSLVGSATVTEEDREEGANLPMPVSTSVMRGSEGSSVIVYDRFNADLSSAISSASAPWLSAYSNYITTLNFTMDPLSALTITGQISGEVFRASTSSIPWTSSTSTVTFDAGFFGFGEDAPQFSFARSTSNGHLLFDEPFSVTAYNRGNEPLLVQLFITGAASANAAPPIPEPSVASMLATGLATLLMIGLASRPSIGLRLRRDDKMKKAGGA